MICKICNKKMEHYGQKYNILEDTTYYYACRHCRKKGKANTITTKEIIVDEENKNRR